MIGIAAFAWFELVYALSGFQAVGLTPHSVAIATLVYTGITFVGMALFGIDKWSSAARPSRSTSTCSRGSHRSRSATAGWGDGGWLRGTTGWATVPGSVALVLLVIGVTAFDGAVGGAARRIRSSRSRTRSTGWGHSPRFASRTPCTCSSRSAAVAAIFWAGIAGMHTVRDRAGQHSTRELGGLVRPQLHPDRARLPRRALLQLLRLPRAGPVHVPALRPAGRRLGPVRHRRIVGIDYGLLDLQPRLVRAGRGARRRARPGARPRPRPRARRSTATPARPPARSTGCSR